MSKSAYAVNEIYLYVVREITFEMSRHLCLLLLLLVNSPHNQRCTFPIAVAIHSRTKFYGTKNQHPNLYWFVETLRWHHNAIAPVVDGGPLFCIILSMLSLLSRSRYRGSWDRRQQHVAFFGASMQIE